MNERLDGISVFVDVAEAGSFALAAQRLGVTRSAVGKIIARLEQRLGVRLFVRTTRRHNLTEDGQIYYERCLRALAELEAAEEAFEGGKREPSGRLRISVPVLFGRHCIAPVMLRLMQRFPSLQIEMSFNDRVADLLEEGYDLAVRIGTLPDTGKLVARRLGVQRMGICASPDYLARHGFPSHREDFARHTGIAYSSAGRVAPWQLQGVSGQKEEIKVDCRLLLDDLQAITDATVAGAGLAWLPCWMIWHELHNERLSLVMGADQLVATDIHVVWPHARHLPSKVRTAIDALVAEVPQMLGQGDGYVLDPAPRQQLGAGRN
ncbi:LysR family transcriptional regulator [Herbaspirillum rhizosphaerae]|uniref:LysR family transcriptional regulator n=1 Tax=Herbaspirillum rhizosphaerae TaxID=346179 RepID=UPI00067B3326|nr:LysR family transcriptional regulator [Herbaspirillum rhizosphaerae]